MKIALVVFDWAGTTVDHGCFAPVVPFVETLRRLGVEVTAREARGPMGLGKKDHLREILRLPQVTAGFRERHGRDWTEDDVTLGYERDFIPLQMESVDKCSEPLPGLLEAVGYLREQEIKVGTTTGYFAEAAEKTYAAAAARGYRPDCNVHPGLVSRGRPAPWMIFRIMETLGVFPPSAVVKIGDTLPDIEEGRNAGVWSVGVTQSGSEIGMSLDEWNSQPPATQARLHQETAARLLQAGAHDVIQSVADTRVVIERIHERLARGERP